MKSTMQFIKLLPAAVLTLATMAALPRIASAQTTPAPTDRIVCIDGTVMPGRVARIQANGTVRVDRPDGPSIPLDAIRKIETSRPIKPVGSGVIVFQRGGGRMAAQSISIDTRMVRVDASWGKPVTLPMEAVAGVLMQFPARWPDVSECSTEFMAAIARESKSDRLFAKVGEAIQSVDGVFENYTPQRVAFEWNGQKKTVAIAKVYGLALASLGNKVDPIGLCLVHMTDGSSLWGRCAGMDSDGNLSLDISGAKVAIPWDSIAGVDVRSSRLAYLSDLDPSAAQQEFFPSASWSWRRDRSVTGMPIELGDKVYEKGLGVHARCELTYDIDSRFDQLVAMIGLQPPAPGVGDCVFVVRGDGRELFRQRVKAGDAPRPIRVEVRGIRRLTLIVDPGDDLDMGDHANWADARIIREK